ncbi:hypothetical protein JCGZ_05150 [Jatropha curcas]|uniref:Uncharacterized protein n=1 Tax=Jatropha curcas TaxID=180498 RepID=A0A067L5T4_JATCU|nr:hypothetical protein JCGZ_05150 [Jatropha curcas]
MRMFGQHGVGTSSSDPTPATDQDVSTALHQPLPSPLDLDTTDDTLVTPADTTTDRTIEKGPRPCQVYSRRNKEQRGQ